MKFVSSRVRAVSACQLAARGLIASSAMTFAGKSATRSATGMEWRAIGLALAA